MTADIQPGEIWWSTLDPSWPVVLISTDGPELVAMQIVAPAPEEQKQGFRILPPGDLSHHIADDVITGTEVPFGPDEGLPRPGVVRLALPRNGHVFCTWQVTLTRDDLTERAGTLTPAKLAQLDEALRLAS